MVKRRKGRSSAEMVPLPGGTYLAPAGPTPFLPPLLYNTEPFLALLWHFKRPKCFFNVLILKLQLGRWGPEADKKRKACLKPTKASGGHDSSGG